MYLIEIFQIYRLINEVEQDQNNDAFPDKILSTYSIKILTNSQAINYWGSFSPQNLYIRVPAIALTNITIITVAPVLVLAYNAPGQATELATLNQNPIPINLTFVDTRFLKCYLFAIN